MTPFQVLLLEFLLWKTNAARSEGVIRGIVDGFPGPEAVLRRSVAELEELLQPLGLFRRRAACLDRFSRQLVEDFDGELPTDARSLQTLNGIGQYAARATACLLAGSRLMPVDANTSRIFGRLFDEEGPPVRTPGQAWDERMEPFVPKREPKRFLWATMDLSAAFCRPREPRCGECPVRRECGVGRRSG